MTPARAPNNIGLLRLVFASLVIFGHAPEMIDGDRSREPLTLVFHTLSLGELAVDAFFLISGYLITQSMAQGSSVRLYLLRRVARIYPAFVLAYAVSVFVLGPIVGAHPMAALPETLGRMAFLQQPMRYQGALVGLPHPSLNGAMWTIAYEFRCYLVVALLGVAGLLSRRFAVLAATALLLAGAIVHSYLVPEGAALIPAHGSILTNMTTGDLAMMLRLGSIFMAGASGYLFREVLARHVTGAVAMFGAVACGGLMWRNPHLAEPAVAVFGGLALYWLAFKANLGPLQSINAQWDVSYGVYLYGWPVATGLLWFHRGFTPAGLAVAAWALCLLFGAVSWWALECRIRVTSRPTKPRALQVGAVPA